MNVCAQCNTQITAKFVKCNGCNSLYHFLPCSTLSEKSYSSMANYKKADWRCHKCQPRKTSTSSNNSYHIVIHDGSQQKQQREDDDESNENTKRFKNSLSLSDVNDSVCFLNKTLTADISDLKTTVQNMATEIKQNNETNSRVESALNLITNTLSTLTSQVNSLIDSNKEKEKQMVDMNKRIDDLEQQVLSKNIEIKNIPNDNIQPNDVVKTIASSLNVEVNDGDISNSYHLKKSQKMIVEFTTLKKKKEFMGKIKRHRVDSNVVTGDTNDRNFMYVNDQLTAHKRKLLWLVKTKAKESNWKFVWVRNGNILVSILMYKI